MAVCGESCKVYILNEVPLDVITPQGIFLCAIANTDVRRRSHVTTLALWFRALLWERITVKNDKTVLSYRRRFRKDKCVGLFALKLQNQRQSDRFVKWWIYT